MLNHTVHVMMSAVVVLQLAAGAVHADAAPPAPQEAEQMRAQLDRALSRTWTRQDYLDAYAVQHADGEWARRLERLRDEPMSLRHLVLEHAVPAATLYRETGNPKYLEPVRAMFRAEAARRPARGQPFSLAMLGVLYDRVKDAPLPAEERDAIEKRIAKQADLCVEREMGSAMNRGILNMLGLAYACKLLPDHPNRPLWQKTHEEAFAQDFGRLQDTNEDATNYNGLWLMVLVDYVRVSGMDEAEFYANPNVRNIFERTLGQLSPLGNIPQYGDANWDIGFMPSSFERAASIYRDGRYKWAAQRAVNYFRFQPWAAQRMPRPPYMAMSDGADDSIAPVEPQTRSYYSNRRYGREYPDKLVLRSGFGSEDTYLLMNLFDAGGHGAADGSAILSLIDGYSVLLFGAHYDENEERNHNLLLVRALDETFPFIGDGPAFPVNRWRRTTVALRNANTALGGITPDLARVSRIGLTLDLPAAVLLDELRVVGPGGSRVLTDFEEGLGNWTGELTSDGRQGRQALRLKESKSHAFALDYPLDLSAYETLEFWWKLESDSYPEPRKNVYVAVSSGSDSNRYHWDHMGSSRQGRVTLLKDFEQAHVTSVEVELKDYLGGDNRQTRDIIMLPGRLVLVRDTLRFGQAQQCQVGPLWHVQNVIERGENWFQTSVQVLGGSFKGGRRQPNTWQNVPRNLMVYFVPQAEREIGAASSPSPGAFRPTCLFQKWSGEAAAGDVLAFNTLLLPNDPGTSAAELASKVSVLLADADATAIRLGPDLVVVNPAGGMLEVASLQTDFRYLVVRDIEGSAPYVAGVSGKLLKWADKTLYQKQSVGDVER